jgi:hypothetical protein
MKFLSKEKLGIFRIVFILITHIMNTKPPGASLQKPNIPSDVIPKILSYCAYGSKTLATASLVNKEWHHIAVSLYITIPTGHHLTQYHQFTNKVGPQPHVTVQSVKKLGKIDDAVLWVRATENYFYISWPLVIVACFILFILTPFLLGSILYYFCNQVPADQEFSHYYLTNCAATNITGVYDMIPETSKNRACYCYQVTVHYYCAINQSAIKNSTMQSDCECNPNKIEFFTSIKVNKTYNWYIREQPYDIRFEAPDNAATTWGLSITAIVIAGIFLSLLPCWIFCTYQFCLRILVWQKMNWLWKDVIKISEKYPGDYVV